MLGLSTRAVLSISGKTVQGDFSALEISMFQPVLVPKPPWFIKRQPSPA
jgi:hypothetical protein